MRLIDVDKLLETLQDLEPHCDNKQYENGMLKMLRYYMPQIINDEPTAYDVDKVVYEFESFAKLAEDRWTNGTSEHAYQEHKCWVKAIEIVKQGGVSDDVCKWKYTKEIMDNAEFKVGCNPNALKRGVVPNNFSYHDFKYCPYCGKKIKVVE